MTARGWWCLFMAGVLLLAGILRDVPALAVAALALLLWFGWEWLFFSIRVRTQIRLLRVTRQVLDERGPLSTLWESRSYTVRVVLDLGGGGRFPYLAVTDPVPFGVEFDGGLTRANGPVRNGEPLELEYRIHCPRTGLARFEGLRLEVTDLQGFFCHVTFLRDPVVLRILPGVLVHRGSGSTSKRHNQLPPPGIHRLRQPGSGSELLDLRDYLPGDPPRTIAWKVSARRDRLITKEFESEVPVRCTLFLDVSSSVRVPSPARTGLEPDEPDESGYFRPLDRLIELAAGVIRANATLRDLTGLCLFDEQSSRPVRPERNTNHQNRLLQLLGEAAALGPVAARADPEALLPIAYALAQEVYPDLLRDEVNHAPALLTWFIGFPRYTRHRRGWIDALHRSKRRLLLWGTTLIPLSLLLGNVVAAFMGWVPEWARTVLGGMLFWGVPVVVLGAWLVFLFSLLASSRLRKLARWRKRLAALLCVRSLTATLPSPDGPVPVPGGLAALIEDDDLLALHLQRFLAEHQVPCAVPLYDEQGRYLFALPEKVKVLADALVHAVSRARDNELYVLLADLLDLDRHLDPLLQAVRLALGRHHQVLVICPWPQDVPMPGDARPPRKKPRRETLQGLLLSLAHTRLHEAFGRIRQVFARLGVQVICAASDASVPLILDRLERVRSARRAPGGK